MKNCPFCGAIQIEGEYCRYECGTVNCPGRDTVQFDRNSRSPICYEAQLATIIRQRDEAWEDRLELQGLLKECLDVVRYVLTIPRMDTVSWYDPKINAQAKAILPKLEK